MEILFFFVTRTTISQIYTLSLHDALPISAGSGSPRSRRRAASRGTGRGSASGTPACPATGCTATDRKSTRLNSSHVRISYAVFCLKKKKTRAQGRLREDHAADRYNILVQQ